MAWTHRDIHQSIRGEMLPEVQGRGVGNELLQVAKRAFDCLQLWTFQRNLSARRFYEARGFALVEETDGSRNEEKEPDARYLWTRTSVRSPVVWVERSETHHPCDIHRS